MAAFISRIMDSLLMDLAREQGILKDNGIDQQVEETIMQLLLIHTNDPLRVELVLLELAAVVGQEIQVATQDIRFETRAPFDAVLLTWHCQTRRWEELQGTRPPAVINLADSPVSGPSSVTFTILVNTVARPKGIPTQLTNNVFDLCHYDL